MRVAGGEVKRVAVRAITFGTLKNDQKSLMKWPTNPLFSSRIRTVRPSQEFGRFASSQNWRREWESFRTIPSNRTRRTVNEKATGTQRLRPLPVFADACCVSSTSAVLERRASLKRVTHVFSGGTRRADESIIPDAIRTTSRTAVARLGSSKLRAARFRATKNTRPASASVLRPLSLLPLRRRCAKTAREYGTIMKTAPRG
jgi:hypothetical protein